jgi:hypothetical protein
MEGDTISNQNDTTRRERDEGSREGTRPIAIRSIIEEYDDRPDECTLYANSVSDRDEWVTSWITAKRGSFVDREEMR